MEINNEVESQEVKSLTITERVKYFFTNPNKLFEEYKIKPTWLIKMLIIIAIAIVYTLIYSKLTYAPQIDMLMNQQPDITREQAEKSMQIFGSPVFSVGLALLGSFIAVFLTSLIYHGLIALFGGKTSYMKVVAVYSLAYIPYYIGELVNLLFASFGNDFTSLLQPRFIDVFFNRFGLFVVWQVLLLVFGFSKIADLKLQKSAVIVGIMWLIVFGFSLIPVFMSKMF